MNRIKWCLEQKKGIELVEPNDNLCKAYFKEAEDTLSCIDPKNEKWALIMAYYACYNSLYAILMKAGIKCEIHDCTLKLMKLITDFGEDDHKLLSGLKDKRIQNQYYLKRMPLTELSSVQDFFLKCKKVALNIDVEKLRGML